MTDKERWAAYMMERRVADARCVRTQALINRRQAQARVARHRDLAVFEVHQAVLAGSGI